MKKVKAGAVILLFLLVTAVGAWLFFRWYTGTESITVTFEESLEAIGNPARGFYCQADTSDGKLPEKLEEEKLRLLLLTLDLKEERDSSISAKKMEELEQMLAKARDAGVKVIFRAAYGFDSEDAYRDPENIELVAAHIRQIATVLNAHRRDILCVQAGFLGPWGEWHHSNLIPDDSYNSFHEDDAARNRVLSEWTGLLEAPVTVNVRRPRYIRDALKAGVPAERLGFHNDALLAGADDMGTYDDPEYTREQELSYIDATLAHGINGGEMPMLSDYTAPEKAVREFERLHLTYLNRGYNEEVLADWKECLLGGESVFDVVSRRLGYRLFLSAAQVNDGLRDFHSMECSLTLTNSGFAAVQRGYRVYGVLDTGEKRRYVPLKADLSQVDGAESGVFSFEQPLSALYDKDAQPDADRPDRLRVGLMIADTELPETAWEEAEPKETFGIVFNDRIRLANTDISWENGINYIGQYELAEGKYYFSKGSRQAAGAATQEVQKARTEGAAGESVREDGGEEESVREDGGEEESVREDGGDEESAKGESAGRMRLVFFKIGKADAILLSSEGKNLLIDTGEEDDGEELLAYMERQGIDKIDALILTHFDKDHVGGADQIVESMEISQIYQPDYDKDSKQFEEYDTSVDDKEVPVYRLNEPVNFSCGGMEVRIYPPLRDNYVEENDFSLITSITFGAQRFLFGGDAEKERLMELTQGEQELSGGLSHSFLKLPHHGRSDPALPSFLDAVDPSYAVITCSEKNPADPEVLALLKERDVEVYLTAEGNVYGESDGETLTLWQ